jgi:hypothetical protein
MIGHLLLSLVLAGGAIAILVRGLRFRPRTPVWGLFILLFFVIWAGGVWMAPAGPVHFGINWLPFVLIAILLTVFVVALTPHGSARQRDEREVEREVVVGLGLYFWVLIGALVAAIIASYQ